MEKSALIVAGGIGKRLDSHTPKQFLILGNKPVLMHTLSKFSHLDKIYLVLPKKYFEKWRALCEKYNFNVKHVLVEGGSTLLGSLFDQNLVDKVLAFISPIIIGGDDAKSPIGGSGVEFISESLHLKKTEVSYSGNDILVTGYIN